MALLEPIEVHSVSQRDRRNDQIESAGAVTLVFVGAVADFAQPVEEDGSRQGVARFAFIESTGDPSA